MRMITDLHIHSRFSRGCSRDLTLPNISKACEKKGIGYVATGDVLHPEWRAEVERELEEREGAFYLKDDSSPTAFCLGTEVSCIYKRGDKTRRLHHVLLFPDLKAVDAVIFALEKRRVNLRSDGRPIMGLDSEELLRIVLDADERNLLIPAHAWTPWFAIFGSKSGFDSLEECFGDLAEKIPAIETGLSSDPPMNWRISALDRLLLVSNSDAHSCENLGREANVLEMEKPNYMELRRILMERDTEKFLDTIEFFPEEGKYHADGHADCAFWCDPEKTKKLDGRCPTCGKRLTVGVLSRVQELADRPPDPDRPRGAVPFRSIIPLKQIISSCIGVGPKSKAVAKIYDRITESVNEFTALMDADPEKIRKIAGSDIAEAIVRMRKGEVQIRPGYDGVFGEISVFEKKEEEQQFLI